jgi:hypothetical protein
MKLLNILIALTFITAYTTCLMADDAYTVIMKETQFGAGGPPDAQGISVEWNLQILQEGKGVITKGVDFHQASAGGIDLVRIVVGSAAGDFTTTQSLLIHMTSQPYTGAVGNAEIAAALSKIATDILVATPGSFTYERDESGVKRFTCASMPTKLVGMYFNGRVAVAQLKDTETITASADVEENKIWFFLIGKDK